MRWNQVSHNFEDRELVIQFDRFPNRLDKVAEKRFNIFKCEVMHAVLKEIKFIKKSGTYREGQNDIQELRKFLKNENLKIVRKDKSERLLKKCT